MSTTSPPFGAGRWRGVIREARRGLWRNEALRRLTLVGVVASACVFGGVLAAAAGVEAGWGVWGLAIALLGVGLLWVLEIRITPTEAAIFVDRRGSGEETFASALALASEGPAAEPTALLIRAEGQATAIDVRRLVRYRPSLAARLLPVLIALSVAVHVGGGSARATSEGGARGPSERAGTSAVIIPSPDAGTEERTPGRDAGAGEVREIFDRWAEQREALEDLAAALRRAGLEAVDGGEVPTAELLAQGALEEIERALAEAARRLEAEGSLSSSVREAEAALRSGDAARRAEALETLAAALAARQAEVGAALTEVRRVARSQGVSLGGVRSPAPVSQEGSVPTGAALHIREILEIAMDREDVPGEYREIIRRYFERKREERR